MKAYGLDIKKTLSWLVSPKSALVLWINAHARSSLVLSELRAEGSICSFFL